MEQYEIPEIDLVIVDLYPFEDTVASGADEQSIIEKIDIGGISLIRAAAKNFKDVVIVASQAQYEPLLNHLNEEGATTSLETRKWFAKEAFAVSSHYDSAIFNYFDNEADSALRLTANSSKSLRYGENPHQRGVFFGDFEKMFEQLQGKEISYNNLLDIDAAVNLIADYDDITFAILKHNNACGVASRPNLTDAWNDALAGDPVSAFGGVLVTNAVIDKQTAEKINEIFFEVIIAPDYDTDALEVLSQKKNRIILIQKETKLPTKQIRTVLNGVLMQDKEKTGAHWASGYLTYAKDQKWLDADVDLDAKITRLEFCRIAAKAKNLTKQPAENPFRDCKDTAVLALVEAGVISGMTKSTFAPDGFLSRAQIAKIIWYLQTL